MKFLENFPVQKPVIGMLHLKGDTRQETFDRFRRELDIYRENGIDGVLLETYFGTYSELEECLEYISHNNPGIPYGVNCLNIDTMGFVLGQRYHAAFIQIDSVAGHVKPRDEESLQAFFDYMRPQYDGAVLGGVRFKYQPVLSGNTVEQDLKLAMNRCDGICVTGEGTGLETSMDKIQQFRNGIGSFPLIVAAGVTPQSLPNQLKVADAVIAGSYFKDNYQDNGDVYGPHVKAMMDSVKTLRGQLND